MIVTILYESVYLDLHDCRLKHSRITARPASSEKYTLKYKLRTSGPQVRRAVKLIQIYKLIEARNSTFGDSGKLLSDSNMPSLKHMTLVMRCNLSAWCGGDEMNLRPALEKVKKPLEALVLSTGNPPSSLCSWLGKFRDSARPKKLNVQSHIFLGWEIQSVTQEQSSLPDKVSDLLPQSLTILTIHCCDGGITYTPTEEGNEDQCCHVEEPAKESLSYTHFQMLPSEGSLENLRVIQSVVVCLESDCVEFKLDSEVDRSRYSVADGTLRLKSCLDVVGTPTIPPASHQPQFEISKRGLAVTNSWVWTQV